MKRALVLSGGGAKGAFQFGALQYIYEQIVPLGKTCPFQVIAGVSVGSLNGVMLAMNGYDDLKKIWLEIDNNKVYSGKLKTFPAIFKIAFGGKAVLSNAPLLALLDRYVDLRKIKDGCDFRFGAVTLNDGVYHSFRPRDFNSNTDFKKAILASTVMPIVWSPVSSIKDIAGKEHLHLVDGGIRNISPLGDVIDEDPDEIIIINCNATELHVEQSSAKNIFSIAKRSLTEIATNEIFRSDLKEFLKVNFLVRQADALSIKLNKESDSSKHYKAFKTHLIQPEFALGDALDFSPATTRERIRLGYEKAAEVFTNEHSGDILSGD